MVIGGLWTGCSTKLPQAECQNRNPTNSNLLLKIILDSRLFKLIYHQMKRLDILSSIQELLNRLIFAQQSVEPAGVTASE
jgi:hypothetical protein